MAEIIKIDWSKFKKNRKYAFLILFLGLILISVEIYRAVNVYHNRPAWYPFQPIPKYPTPIYPSPKLILLENLTEISNTPKELHRIWGWEEQQINIITNTFTDINNDGYKDVILNIRLRDRCGGYMYETHNLTAIDFHNRKLLWFLVGAGGTHFEPNSPLVDLNGDNKKELVLTTDYNETSFPKIVVVDASSGKIIREISGKWDLQSDPIIADVNNDGIKEIIMPNNDLNVTEDYVVIRGANRLSVFDSSNATELWSVTKINDENIEFRFDDRVSVGVDTQTNESIIIASPYLGPITAFYGRNGTLLWSHKVYSCWKPAIGDINGDGKLEVIFGTQSKIFALTLMDGKVLWRFHSDIITPVSTGSYALGDLNNDGALDVVIAHDYALYAINGKTGELLWKFVPDSTYISDIPRFDFSSPILADLDNDKRLDILIRGIDLMKKEKYTCAPTFLAFRGYDGKLLWTWNIHSEISLKYTWGQYIYAYLAWGSPYVGDIDNDGHLEIVFTFVDDNMNLFLGILGTDGYSTGSRVYWQGNGGNSYNTGCSFVSDPDADTLSSSFEIILGSNPYSADSDNDLLPDYYEYLVLDTSPTLVDTNNNGINDTFEDFDNDKLPNLLEFYLGTNPFNSDSDEDLLNDSIDPYPLFPDGWIYWSICLAVVILPPFVFILIRFLKRNKFSSSSPKPPPS